MEAPERVSITSWLGNARLVCGQGDRTIGGFGFANRSFGCIDLLPRDTGLRPVRGGFGLQTALLAKVLLSLLGPEARVTFVFFIACLLSPLSHLAEDRVGLPPPGARLQS